MQRRIRASSLVAAVAVVLVLGTLPGCRKPKETTVGSTDTIQSTTAQTTGTTATETGGGPPVTTSSTTATTSTAGATGTH